MALNSTQQDILDGFLKFIFDSCADFRPEEALVAFKSMLCQQIPPESQKILEKLDICDLREQIRDIFSQSCPQNRKVGDPTAANGRENGIIGNEVYYWVGGFGGELKHETQGLLGLTAKNDEETSPVTKDDVVNYIKHSCYMKIHEYSFKLGLTTWDYFSVPQPGNGFFGQNRENFYLKFLDQTIRIQTKSLLARKNDTYYQENINNITTISLIIRGEDNINRVKEDLHKDQPKIVKRVRAGNGCDSFTVSLSESGFFHCGFSGKDEAMGALLDILNKYAFEDKIPLYLLNQLRQATGQELKLYQDDIAYEEIAETELKAHLLSV